MPPKIVHKTPHGSIVQHDDGTTVILPDHYAAALTADPVAPLAGASAPPGALTAKDKAVLQAHAAAADPQLLRYQMDLQRKSDAAAADPQWNGGGIDVLEDAGGGPGAQPQSQPAPSDRPAQKKPAKLTPAQAIFAGLGTVGTALNGGGVNPVIGQIDAQNLVRADKIAAAAGSSTVPGALPVYDPLTPVAGRPGQTERGRLVPARDFSNTGEFGGTYLTTPPSSPIAGVRGGDRDEPRSIVAMLRAQGLTGAALENKLHELGYNTSGFGGR